MVAVKVDGAQRPGAALHMQPVGAALNLGTHGARSFDKANIALDGVQAHALNFDAILACKACAERAKRYEIAS